jgi:hypothetical protein
MLILIDGFFLEYFPTERVDILMVTVSIKFPLPHEQTGCNQFE